jgi:hypothetical protein
MILFGELKIGDLFLYHGSLYQVVPMVKTGAGCCKTPHYNAKSMNENDTNEGALMRGESKVEQVFPYKMHPSNEELVEPAENIVIIVDEESPVLSDIMSVEPTVTHHSMEFDETDVWLAYFGLGKLKPAIYYEEFINNEWVPRSKNGTLKLNTGSMYKKTPWPYNDKM